MKPYLPSRITSLLLDQKEFPAWPNRISFSWDEFSKGMSELFGKNIQVIFGKADWKIRDQLLLGLGELPVIVTLEIMPLASNVYVAASQDSINKISSWLIEEPNAVASLVTKEIQEGFFRFLLIKSLFLIEEMPISEGLTFHIKEEDIPFLENSYVIDIEVKNDNHSAWVRCVFPKIFQESFKKHFAAMSPLRDEAKISSIELLCKIEGGETSLTRDEIRSLRAGDFLFLQSGQSYKLTMAEKPLFHINVEEGGIKIIDYADYYGVDMAENFDVISEEETAGEKTKPKRKKGEEITSLKEVPLLVRVEIARLSITMEKLLHLSPGDFLELGISSSDPVYLNVNGQRIGTGELLQLEDRVGVRITNINA